MNFGGKRVTKKSVKENYKYQIEIPYGYAQHLLIGRNRSFYTTGVYGWNADVFHINNDVCIVTGYNPFGNNKPKTEIVKKYDDMARNSYRIYCDSSLTYDEIVARINIILHDFIKEVLNQ